MFNMKPPFRLAIANTFMDNVPRSAEEVMDKLEPAYAGEKQFTLPTIDKNIQSLKTVGILKVESEEDGRLRYLLSEYGRKKVAKAL